MRICAICLLLILPQFYKALGQSDIAVFSKMIDAQEEIDLSAADAKDNTASVEMLVRGLRNYTGLEGRKSYTIFVPNNQSFKKLPKNTVAYFINGDNKKALDELLSFHVINGKYAKSDLLKLVEQGGGKTYLKTLSGFKIYFKRKGDNLELENEAGKTIRVTAFNYKKGEGIIHIVDSVIIPFDAGLMEDDMEERSELKKRLKIKNDGLAKDSSTLSK